MPDVQRTHGDGLPHPDRSELGGPTHPRHRPDAGHSALSIFGRMIPTIHPDRGTVRSFHVKLGFTNTEMCCGTTGRMLLLCVFLVLFPELCLHLLPAAFSVSPSHFSSIHGSLQFSLFSDIL